jgi:hypothetical protein
MGSGGRERGFLIDKNLICPLALAGVRIKSKRQYFYWKCTNPMEIKLLALSLLLIVHSIKIIHDCI